MGITPYLSWGSFPTCQMLSAVPGGHSLPARCSLAVPALAQLGAQLPQCSARGHSRSHGVSCPPLSPAPPQQGCTRQSHTVAELLSSAHSPAAARAHTGLHIPSTNRSGALSSPKMLPRASSSKSISAAERRKQNSSTFHSPASSSISSTVLVCRSQQNS